MGDFRKLHVWQKAHAMALGAENVAGRIRGTRHSFLRNQIVRAAMSVPANIVEGSRQQSPREFSRFVRIALNSATEVEYHLLAARDLRIIPNADSVALTDQVIEVRKMLYGLLRYLASRSNAKTAGPGNATSA
jgi:four helix bundle protein